MGGPRSVYADECYRDGFIGADYGLDIDLTDRLPDRWQEFNREFRPIYLEKFPDKTKIAAGLACGFIHTVS